MFAVPVMAFPLAIVSLSPNSGTVGDTVEISETRPLSKNKRWEVLTESA